MLRMSLVKNREVRAIQGLMRDIDYSDDIRVLRIFLMMKVSIKPILIGFEVTIPSKFLKQ